MKFSGTNKAVILSLLKFYSQNVQIKPNSKLLIIADEITDPRVYNYLGKAAEYFIPSGDISIFIFKKPSGFNYNFPPELLHLLKEADVIISPTTISIYHARELQQALTKTKKFFSMTGATIETLYKYGAQADFVSISKTAAALKELLTDSKRISVFSKAGTHFSAIIENRTANMETSIGTFGKSATFPDIEVNTSIIEDSGEGRIIIDGSATGLGVFNKPVEFIVNKGKIVSINGGKEAKAAEKLLKKTADPNMYQIAEIGIGLNPFSKIYGVIIEDEACYGTSHFGIGQNIFMGGLNKAKTHIDFVMKNPQIFIDGSELFLGKDKITFKNKMVGKIYRQNLFN
jgi:2,5-dihydroxypyridine 5,6-dioxygenase